MPRCRGVGARFDVSFDCLNKGARLDAIEVRQIGLSITF
jgi:hypothetical protein